jgi:D-aspartate ligase
MTISRRGVRAAATLFDTSTPALVLKVGRYPLVHGGLGIIRTLGRVGVPVYGVHEDRLAPAAASSYLAGKFIWRTGGENVERFLQGMAELGRHLGRRALLVPTDDLAAILVAEHAADLEEWFVFPRAPASLPRTVASKWGLYQLCKRLGVPCPEAVIPRSRSDVEAFLDRATFPVVAKGAEAWLLPGSGVKSTTIVKTPEQLLNLYDRVTAGSSTGVIFQEYIPRDCGEDWIFHGYCDARSECLAGFTGVKLRSYPPYAGPTALGRCASNEALRREAQALLKAISYRGIMDLDYRLDRRDGLYKLLDFNPRVGAQFRLFEDDAGIDVVRALHLDLTGRPVPRGRPRDGRGFVAEPYDLLASWGYHRDGGLTMRAWLRSLKGVEEWAWIALDDLAPLPLMCLRYLGRAVKRALRLKRSPVADWDPPRYIAGPRRLMTSLPPLTDGQGKERPVSAVEETQ